MVPDWERVGSGWGLELQDTADMGRTREDVHNAITIVS